MTKTFAFLGGAVIVSVAAGVLLDVATFLVARYGPQADGWSYRGNGALSIPFGLGPAILAGLWSALVFRYRGFDHWRILGALAALIGVAFLLVSVFVLLLLNSEGMGISNAMFYLILGWMLVAPILAGFVPGPKERPKQSVGVHLGAGIMSAVAVVAAFFVSGLVLAPGS
jgi:hypothetical protein